MRWWPGALGVFLGLIAVAACGQPPAPSPSAKPAPAGTVTAVTRAPAPHVERAPIPNVPPSLAPGYDPKGRRDPFEVLEVRAGTARSIASARLVGIVRGPRLTLALVETSEGLGYIMKPGDTLGDSRLMEIGADSVIFTTTPRPGAAPERVVLRLPAD